MNTNYDEIFTTDNKVKSKHFKVFPPNIFMVCCGPTSCGKTNLMCNILLKGYTDYDDVGIWSTTLHQSKYCGLREIYKQANIPAAFYENFEDIPDPSDFDPSQIHVMVFDDVMNKEQSKINEYFCRGRHNNFNVFYLCQSLYKLPKHGIRENANVYVLFPLNLKTLKSFYDEYVGNDMDYNEFKNFCKKAWRKNYGYVVINTWSTPKEYKYLDNYEEIYTPQQFIKNKSIL